MEDDSRSSTIPPNFVTIKDLQERWLKQRRQQQQEEQEKQKQQPESLSGSQPLHTGISDRGKGNESSGRLQASRAAGKLGRRIGWEARFLPESSERWWSSKEGGGIARVQRNSLERGEDWVELSGASDSSVKAAGTGENARWEEADGEDAPLMIKGVKDESWPENNGAAGEKEVKVAVGGRSKLPINTPRGRVSSSKAIQDKSRSESDSLRVHNNGVGKEPMNGIADVLPEEVAGEGVLPRKGVRHESRSKGKSAIVENGEMATGDGGALLEGASGEGASSEKGMGRRLRSNNKSKVVEIEVAVAAGEDERPVEGAAKESVPLRKGARNQSKSKNKNVVKKNQVKLVDVLSIGGSKDENGTKGTSILMPLMMAGDDGLALPEEASMKREQSWNSKKKKRKGKSKKHALVESKENEVESGPGIKDAVSVDLALEIGGKFHRMSTNNYDQRVGLGRSEWMERRMHTKGSRGRFDEGGMVWVKKGEDATGGVSQHSSSS